MMRWRYSLLLHAFIVCCIFCSGAVFESWWIDNKRETLEIIPSSTRPAPRPYTLPLQYAPLTIYWCDLSGVPVWLMSRVFMAESWWNPNARNSIGAAGLGQIMPFNLEKFAELYNDGEAIDPYDPATAIRVSTLYMADLVKLVGDWKNATGAYHTGPYRPPAKWKPETVRYVRQVWGE